jgi:hypothetical protein
MEARRKIYRILEGKLKGMKLLGKPKHGCVDNIKVDLRLDGVVWATLIWLRMRTCGGLL